MIDLLAPLVENRAFQRLYELFDSQGYQFLIVGGAVRDALAGQNVHDIDFATSAAPQTAMDILTRAGIKAIPTGIEHGTVTAVLEPVNYEITTFRRDIETDGRHARVAFGTDVHSDALRRDFTINALYLSAHGELIDPLNAQADLANGRLKFIGNPQDRITEDRLRALRFFRFWARFGSEYPDESAQKALRFGFAGLGHLSQERIGQEILKIAGLPRFDTIAQMIHDFGGHPAVFETWDFERLRRGLTLAAEFEDPNALDPLLRLCLITDDPLFEKLRLSKAQGKTCESLRAAAKGSQTALEFGLDLCLNRPKSHLIMQRAAQNSSITQQDMSDIERGMRLEFPLKSQDLFPFFSGPALGSALRRGRKIWIASDCRMGKAELINALQPPG